jgi:AcrR family transcriptional regulator
MDAQTFHTFILQTEQDGLVHRTFRRLDPDKQQAILDAILAEANEVGPDQIRIQAVAQKAGVSVGSMYQYFPDRERLLAFAVQLCTKSMVDMFEMYIPILAAMPLREGIKAYLMGGLEMGETERGVVQFFGRAAYQGKDSKLLAAIEPIAVQMYHFTCEILRQAQLRGEIRLDVDLETAARVVNTLLIAVGDSQLFPYLNTYYRLAAPGIDFEQTLDVVIDMILKGLAPSIPSILGESHA